MPSYQKYKDYLERSLLPFVVGGFQPHLARGVSKGDIKKGRTYEKERAMESSSIREELISSIDVFR